MGDDDPSKQDMPESQSPPGQLMAAAASDTAVWRDDRPVWQRLAPMDSWSPPLCDKALQAARDPGAPQHGHTDDEADPVWQTRLELQGRRAAGAGLAVTLAAAALWSLWPGLTPADGARRLPPDAAGLDTVPQWLLASREPALAPDAPSAQLSAAAPVADLAAAVTESNAAACIAAAAPTEPAPLKIAQPQTDAFEPSGFTASSLADLTAFVGKYAQKAAPARHARRLSRKEAAAPQVTPAPAIPKASSAPKPALARIKPAGPLSQFAHGVDIAGTGAQSGLTNLVLGVRRLLTPRRAKSG